MRYIVTYTDANHNKQIRFFKKCTEMKTFLDFMRDNGSAPFYDFQIKMIKPY